jgi:glycosyltransferase involved in cell wall biosynthesis
MPKVSVIIPVKNGERYLREALDSVMAQTFRDFEVVVADDASTDSTAAIARSYPSVRYIYREHSEGVSRARNAAIRAAEGQYLASLDCDDLWYPEKLALQVPILDRDPLTGVVYSDQEWIDQEGRTIKVVPHSNWPKGWDRYFCGGHNIGPSTMLVRKELIEKIGFYDEELWANEDKDLNIRLHDVCQIKCVEKALIKKRRSPKSFEARHNQREEVLNSALIFLRKLDRRALTSEQARYLDLEWSYYHSNLGKHLMAKGQQGQAVQSYLSAIRRAPFVAKTYGRLFRCLLRLR